MIEHSSHRTLKLEPIRDQSPISILRRQLDATERYCKLRNILTNNEAIFTSWVWLSIRTGMRDRLDSLAHTSVSKRLVEASSDPVMLTSRLKPVDGCLRPTVDITTAEYLQLLDWTGRQLAPGKRGRIPMHALAILATLDQTSNAGPPASPRSAAAGIALPARHRISSHWPSRWGSDGSKEFGLP